MQEMKATIRKRSKLKATSATDIEQQQMFQDEVSHMDENSHRFRRWRNKLCSRKISRLDHRTYRGSLQVGTREAAGRLWWNCRWWDRLATFSKLPNSKTAGLLWKGVPSWISPNDLRRHNVKISGGTTPRTSFMITPARESEKTSAARWPCWIEMFLQIPRVFAGCPAGVPAYLKSYEWSLIEHTFLSFLLSSLSPPPKIFSSKLYSPFLLLFFIPF